MPNCVTIEFVCTDITDDSNKNYFPGSSLQKQHPSKQTICMYFLKNRTLYET